MKNRMNYIVSVTDGGDLMAKCFYFDKEDALKCVEAAIESGYQVDIRQNAEL